LLRTAVLLPSLPAALIVGFLGLGRGPDGFPTERDAVLHVFTFLLWWGGVELVRIVHRSTTDH
jgi:hypothetical protein